MPRVFKSTKPQSAQRMIATVEFDADPLLGPIDESYGEYLLGTYVTADEVWYGKVMHVRYEDTDGAPKSRLEHR